MKSVFRVLVLLGLSSLFSSQVFSQDSPIWQLQSTHLVGTGLIWDDQINNGGKYLIAEDYSGNIEDTIDLSREEGFLSYNYYRLRPSAWFDNTVIYIPQRRDPANEPLPCMATSV